MTLLAAEKTSVSPKSGKGDGCTRERNIKKWYRRWEDYWYEDSVLQHLFPGAKWMEGSATSYFFFLSKKKFSLCGCVSLKVLYVWTIYCLSSQSSSQNGSFVVVCQVLFCIYFYWIIIGGNWSTRCKSTNTEEESLLCKGRIWLEQKKNKGKVGKALKRKEEDGLRGKGILSPLEIRKI